MQEGAKQGFPSGNTPPNGFSWSRSDPLYSQYPHRDRRTFAQRNHEVQLARGDRGGLLTGLAHATLRGSLSVVPVFLGNPPRANRDILIVAHKLT